MVTHVLDEGWIIGIRIDVSQEDPNLYYIVTGDELEPITHEGAIVFSNSMSNIDEIMNLCGRDLSIQAPHSGYAYHLCDVAETLYRIESEDRDEAATVLECLNSLFDLVKCTRQVVPDSVKTVLYPLADHLTFNNQLDEYFHGATFSREQTIDSVLWCVGWVATHGRFLPPGITDGTPPAG